MAKRTPGTLSLQPVQPVHPVQPVQSLRSRSNRRTGPGRYLPVLLTGVLTALLLAVVGVGSSAVTTFAGQPSPHASDASSGVASNPNPPSAPAPDISCSSAGFAPAVNYGAITNPYAMAMGDFNGDGKQDLATANINSNNVSILLGVGNGTFGAATNFPVGASPSSVAVGDFNADGKQDLAVSNKVSNNVSILLGAGNGTFGAATNFMVGVLPQSVAVGDFNADGKQDLATANQGSNDVSILLGVGNGSFGAANNFPVGNLPTSVAVGDFNADGKQDLAVANYGSDNVSILLGVGNGTFGAATNFPVGTNPTSVAVGDFNADGKQDLAVANEGSDNVSILLGAGNGTFGVATNFTVGTAPSSVAVGDFNADGKQDIAAANNISNNVSILLGTGTGLFGAATNYGVGNGPTSVAVEDFNADGRQDLAAANFYSNNVSVLIGNCTAVCQLGSLQLTAFDIAGTLPQSEALGDFNRDGYQDLATANSGASDVGILLGASNGFQQRVLYAAGTSPKGVVVGDFNGDGKQDLATANSGSNNVSILLGDGTGAFNTHTEFGLNGGTGPTALAVGDFDRNGRQDLLTANFGSNNLSILLGNGAGGFGTATNISAANGPTSVALGDWNSDGIQDLAVTSKTAGVVTTRLGNGTGGFGATSNVTFAAGANPAWVAVGEFNSDGIQDLAIANNGSNNVTWLQGVGTGTFLTTQNYGLNGGAAPVSVAVADFNGDGIQDLLTANNGSANVSMLLGNGSGSFGTATNFDTATATTFVVVGDFNRDGKQDVAASKSSGSNVAVLRGICVPATATPTNTPVPSPTACAAGYTVALTTGATIVPGVVDTGNHTDDGSSTIALPFTFTFYGVGYTTADVGSNGFMAFGGAPNNSFTTSCLPAAATALHLFPFWVDQTTGAPGKGIYTLVTGTAPNRVLYIEWRNCLFGTATSCLANGDTSYEVILREGSSSIEVVYGTMGSATGAVGTRGVQKDTGTFTQYSCGSGATSGQRLTYTPGGCGTATNTPVVPPSATSTRTNTPQPTNTATRTNTPQPTQTTGGPSATPIPTNTRTATTAPATSTRTNTPPVANTATRTFTPQPTNTPGPTSTACATGYTVALTTGGTIVPGVVDTGNHSDDGSSTIALPFSFTFYGVSYNTADVGSNGFMAFGGAPNNNFQTSCLPAVAASNLHLFPFWVDQTTGAPGKGIYTLVTGTSPNRVLYIEWRNCLYGTPTSCLANGDTSYEVILREGSSTIEVVYGTMGSATGTVGTRGVQKDTGTYTQYSCNAGATSGQRLTYSIPVCITPTNTPIPPTATRTSTNTVTPGVTSCPLHFADVPPSDTFYPFVRCLACRGIINGYPCGGPGEPCNGNNDPYFRPGNNLTRGQLAKIVSNAAGLNGGVSGQSFEDVPPANAFYIFIERLYAIGAIGGYACGGPGEPCGVGNLPYYRPGANVTRGQLTKIVSNAAGFTDPAPGTYTFADVPVGSTFHVFVERLLMNRPGVMGGYPCGGPGEPCDPQNRPYFRVNANLTRGQTSKIVGNTFFPNCVTPFK